MKGKLKFIVPIAGLLLVFGVYKFVFATPADSDAKVHGQVYVLPKEFVVNMAGGRYAKLTVGLVLSHDEKLESGGHAPPPPEGFGPLAQEALVREIVTDTLTGGEADELTASSGRGAYKRKILHAVKSETDVHAEDVVFTDVAVQ
jgi:flagellar basal body-associated protein FliL